MIVAIVAIHIMSYPTRSRGIIVKYKRFDGNIYRNLKKLSLLFCYVNEHDFESIGVGVGGGGTPRKIGRGVWFASENPYPIYDQNVRYSLPYL